MDLGPILEAKMTPKSMKNLAQQSYEKNVEKKSCGGLVGHAEKGPAGAKRIPNFHHPGGGSARPRTTPQRARHGGGHFQTI